MKIAILCIDIGKYICFWKDLYESTEKYFLPGVTKEYFVFSDQKEIQYANEKKVHIINQKNLGWPYNTLMRYQMFLSIEEQLEKFDYIFFFNANLLILEKIGREILPSEREQLVFVKRMPSFIRKEPNPYESNPKSTAYVNQKESALYVRGGLNGGETEAYLKMCHILKDNIDKDLQNNIIAIWHDESHITRYAIDHPEAKILPPSYLYPEEYVMPYNKHILVRKKNKNRIRFGLDNKWDNMKSHIILQIRNLLYKILIGMKVIPFDYDS